MSAYLAGLGTAVPETAVSNAESLQIANALCGPYLTDSGWLPNVYKHCGVNTRHQIVGRGVFEDLRGGTRHSGSPFLPGSAGGPTTAERMVLYAKEAPLLALTAARNALASCNIPLDSITHVVTVSCTGFVSPGIESSLIRDLSLSADVQRTQIGFMGCHGAINGLRVAAAITTSDPKAVVLLVAVELCSLHYYYGAEPAKVIANALFADGAAAAIITGMPTGTSILASGSHIIADTEREMAWIVGDHGFTMTMTKQIPKLISMHLQSWLEPWLEGQGCSSQDIDNWAVHPGGPKILDAVQDAMILPHNALTASREILSQYGNMSSPTVLFILQQLRQERKTGRTLLLGFGPGLVVEAAILQE